MSFPTDVAAEQLQIATDITSKTAASSITPTNVGGNLDAICELLLDLYGIVVAAGDLAAVLALGNTAATDIILTPTGAFSAVNGASAVTILNNAIRMKASGTYNGYLQIAALTTADKQYILPNEPTAVGGLASQIVLHTTAEPLSVTDGIIAAAYDKDGIFAADNAGAELDAHPSGVTLRTISGSISSELKHDPYKIGFTYANPVGPVTIQVDLNFLPASLLASSAITVNMPASSGTLALLSDVAAASNFSYALAPDAPYTIPDVHYFVELGTITTSRVLTFPTPTAGAQLTLVNLNATANNWNFGGTVRDAAGTLLSTIANGTTLILIGNGSLWRKVN